MLELQVKLLGLGLKCNKYEKKLLKTMLYNRHNKHIGNVVWCVSVYKTLIESR